MRWTLCKNWTDESSQVHQLTEKHQGTKQQFYCFSEIRLSCRNQKICETMAKFEIITLFCVGVFSSQIRSITHRYGGCTTCTCLRYIFSINTIFTKLHSFFCIRTWMFFFFAFFVCRIRQTFSRMSDRFSIGNFHFENKVTCYVFLYNMWYNMYIVCF